MTGDLERDGFARMPGLLDEAECDRLIASFQTYVQGTDASILGSDRAIYAARNLLDWWPEATTFWQRPAIVQTLTLLLGPSAGLVRGLYFDKPPGQSWTLPWHKDLTIAVAEHRGPWQAYRHPTLKAGVLHLEAPEEVLQKMLTLRLHLDEVTQENGPLKVVVGSHRTGKRLELTGEVRILHAQRGEGLLMRPLLAHASSRSDEGTSRHRRVVHLEFAASEALPEGVRWHRFLPVQGG
ncbi:MAG: phytanoyl-CoA dioxygenase family protein [Gemmataceae bacterium]